MKKPVRYRLDKSVVTIGTLGDHHSALEYWLKQPPIERLRALEYLRQLSGYDPTQRLDRSVITVKRLRR